MEMGLKVWAYTVLATLVLAGVVNIASASGVDINDDGIVNLKDYATLANNWHKIEPNLPGDINRDNIVDPNDLKALAECWSIDPSIMLEIYSDGWGNLLETYAVDEEGEHTLLVYEEEPYSYPYNPATYYVYAKRGKHYTEIYNCEASGVPPYNFITVDVNLDPIIKGKFNGTIFMSQWFFSDRYLRNTEIDVMDGDIIVTEFQTDEQGRFAIELEPNDYFFDFISDWEEEHHQPVSIIDNYQDFIFYDHAQAAKPVIYLYPEETIGLDVEIVFPYGGKITESIPDYNGGWHVTVEPSGIIDGQYDSLFYESEQPDQGQYESGWVVAREQLEDFFTNNMADTKFNQKEIDDFVAYWIPRLTEHPYYAIYPQYNDELEDMIRLTISPQPDNLIRLIYSIRGLEENNLQLPEPSIPLFEREGFTATEWGVTLK